MRILVTNSQQTSTLALKQTLLKADTSGAAFAKLQRLNPHVDFERIPPGTVLLLPEEAGIEPEAGFAASGDAFESLSADLGRALDATSKQIKDRLAQNQADTKVLTAALKVKGIATQIAADPGLTAQVKAAATRSADVAKKGAADQKALDETRRELAVDLAALRKLLG
jgi:hypothetical protein